MKPVFLCILLALMATLACGGRTEETERVTPVTVMVAEDGVITRTVVSYCRLESGSEALVTPVNPGRIVEVNVRQGDTVKAGDVLVVLSTDQQYSGSVAAAAAMLEASRALASNRVSDLRRADRLRDDGAISESEHEMAVSANASAQAAVSQAWAAYQSARSMSESGRILAPFSGTVSRVWAREGDISSGPLVSLTDSGIMTAELLISERHLVYLYNGMPVVFMTDHYPDELFNGEVYSFSNSVDPISGLVSVKIRLEDNTGRLRSGMTGTAVLALETSEDRVVLPMSVLDRSEDGSWEASVIRDGRAVRVPLETGIASGTNLQVLSGVQPGDSVIALGHNLVTDGSSVRVVER